MKNEYILDKLNNFIQYGDMGIIEELKEKLILDIKKDSNYKINGKSRTNAISRMMKFNHKNGMLRLEKCHAIDNKFMFTNSYFAIVLNNNLGYEVLDDNVGTTLFSNCNHHDEEIKINPDDIIYLHKIKEKTIILDKSQNDISFDVNYIKDIFDIMGKSVKFYYKINRLNNDIDKKFIYFENDDNEYGLLVGILKNN